MPSDSSHCRVEVLCGQANLLQVLCISGEDDVFGSWQVSRAVDLTRSSYSRFFVRLPRPTVGSEFKLALREPGESDVIWEPLDNNRFWPEDASTNGAALRLFFGIPGHVLDFTEAELLADEEKIAAAAAAEKAAWENHTERVQAIRAEFESASCDRTAMELAVAELTSTQQAASRNAAAQQAVAEQATIDQVAIEKAAIDEAALDRASRRKLRLDHAAMAQTGGSGSSRDNFGGAKAAAKQLEFGCRTVTEDLGVQARSSLGSSWDVSPAVQLENEDEDARLREALLQPVHPQSAPLSAKKLQRALQRARQQVAREHRACSGAWHVSLSHFNERDEQQARDRGIPAWAVIVVAKAQVLVEEAVCIYDLLDVYETQVQVAKRDGVGLMRGPLLQILEMCEVLAQRLHAFVSPLEAARAAFDQQLFEVDSDIQCDSSVHGEWPVDGSSGALLGSQRKLRSPSGARQAPTKILSPMKHPGLRQEGNLVSGVFHFLVNSTADIAHAALGAMEPSPQASIDNARPVSNIGRRALISGLQNAPQFNSQWCCIEAYDAELDKYIVRVDTPKVHSVEASETPFVAKLKLENLIVQAH